MPLYFSSALNGKYCLIVLCQESQSLRCRSKRAMTFKSMNRVTEMLLTLTAGNVMMIKFGLRLPLSRQQIHQSRALFVLLQEFEEGNKIPVAYASGKLLPRERNYSFTDMKWFALVWGINKVHKYLSELNSVLSLTKNLNFHAV